MALPRLDDRANRNNQGMPSPLISQLVRTAVVGLAGTTAMTTTIRLERAARPGATGPIDYDASDHVVTAASTLLPRPPRTSTEREAVFVAVRWGYGSSVAALYRLLRQRFGRRASAATFFALCQGMAFTLFPTLGETPPPWRWRRAVLLSSLGQHAVYVAGVVAADEIATRVAAPRS